MGQFVLVYVNFIKTYKIFEKTNIKLFLIPYMNKLQLYLGSAVSDGRLVEGEW